MNFSEFYGPRLVSIFFQKFLEFARISRIFRYRCLFRCSICVCMNCHLCLKLTTAYCSKKINLIVNAFLGLLFEHCKKIVPFLTQFAYQTRQSQLPFGPRTRLLGKCFWMGEFTEPTTFLLRRMLPDRGR